MKRRKLVFAALIIIFLALTCYLLLAFYYSSGFSLNTWINGIYCTGKTVDEVNQELLSNMEVPSVTITDKDGGEYIISLEEAGYTGDYKKPLEDYMTRQNPFLWIDNLLGSRSHTLAPAVTYEEEKIREQYDKLPFVEQEKNREQVLEIVLTEEGYQLINGLKDRMNVQKGYDALKQTIAEGKSTLHLAEKGCYEEFLPSLEQQRVLDLWEQVAERQITEIVYDMGTEKIPIDSSIASHFLLTHQDGTFALDNDGRLMVSQDGIQSFINSLAEEYNTYGQTREFAATRGENVSVKGGIYGTELDVKAEVEYLNKAFTEKKAEVHIPAYKREGYVRGKDDIGDTYIEIDMTDQKMYYYQAGECLIETDVVTGNTSRRMGTPEGVNYVYNKQKNRVLRGPGYASPVKFWIPVKGNIGIHDASWRSTFGDEIYKKSGSHGCINTPLEQVTQLYDLVEIGTPVIMFY